MVALKPLTWTFNCRGGYCPPKIKSHNNQAGIFFLNFLNLFYFWLHWVFIAACGLSLVAGAGASLVAEHGL